MRVLISVVLLFFALSMVAADRNPWELTLEERLALRVDPHAAAARLRVHADDAGVEVGRPPQFVIDGAHNPELFLPGELMSFLLSEDETRRPALVRYQTVLESLHWDPAKFWSDLDAAASDYTTLMRDTLESPRSEAVSRQLCATRILALTRMRQKYERFDEFLYRAVASAATVVGDRPATRDWLLWLERGCE